jgi:hypothetical protein
MIQVSSLIMTEALIWAYITNSKAREIIQLMCNFESESLEQYGNYLLSDAVWNFFSKTNYKVKSVRACVRACVKLFCQKIELKPHQKHWEFMDTESEINL